MLTNEQQKIIETQRLGFVATSNLNGSPNVSPKGTFVVVSEDELAFGEIRSPNTIRNLHVDERIEVNFVDPFSRKGIRVSGVGKIIAHGGVRFEELYPRFGEWPSLQMRIAHIVTISIKHVAPLTSPIYDDGADEEVVRAGWRERFGCV
jgi:predicted pyridoxine 5'-phosphate oxidase superfamily flavin-nucleotide-binding protein